MRSGISICGAGALGIYYIEAKKAEACNVSLHSLRDTPRNIDVEYDLEDGKSSKETIEIKQVHDLCDIIFLVCDVSRIGKYIKEIKKIALKSTPIYLMQNGLIKTEDKDLRQYKISENKLWRAFGANNR